MSFSTFHLVDEFASLAMDQGSAPSHFLGDVSISFESSSSSGPEPTVPYPGDYSQISMDTMDYQDSTDLVPVGFFPPLVTDCVSYPPGHFNGGISLQDTHWTDVKRYMDKHGRPPHHSACDQEAFDFGRVGRSRSKYAPSTIPATPVQKQEKSKPQKTVGQVKMAPVGEKWERFDDLCSVEEIRGHTRYRCDLCKKTAKSYDDMKRHFQSLEHQPKGFSCPTPGCNSVYTRSDALKRHQKTCLI